MIKTYKFKILLFAFFLFTSASLFAQIPNAGFGNWVGGSCNFGLTTYEDPQYWGTINVLTCGASSFTANKASGAQAHSGSYALQLTTLSIFGNTAPGICATGVINQNTQNIDGGFADTTHHSILKGWFKYSPANPDTFSVQVDFYSTSIAPANLIGSGYFSCSTNVGSYTEFSAYINYTRNSPQDSAVITILCSSAATHGNAGSTAYVDDLSFVNCAGFTATPSVTNAICTPNGVASVAVSGGTAPYRYLWNGGTTGSSISNVGAGTYTVNITDTNGCILNDTLTVASSTVTLTAGATPTTTSCTSNTGTVTTTVSGGVQPYVYFWANTDTTRNLDSLGAGTYNLTVTDVHGCTGTASATIVTPNGPTATDSVTNIRCHGGTNGAVNVTVSGGTGAIAYHWSPVSDSTNSATGLSAGTYTVTISDVNNCSFLITAVVNQPDSLILSAVVTPVPCYGGSTGSVVANVSGGTGPYSYLWSNLSHGNDISGLTASNYALAVSDSNGCSVAGSFNVTQPAAALSISFTTTSSSTGTSHDGKIQANVTGGTASYTYAWPHGATDTISHLAPGSYCLTVTDANQCTAVACDTVSSIPVGIANLEEVAIKIYPNPASSEIVIESSTSGKYIFALFSMDGRLMEEKTLSDSKVRVQVSQLSPALYCYQLKNSVTGNINYGKLEIIR